MTSTFLSREQNKSRVTAVSPSSLLFCNGDEEFLQRDQGDEGEGPPCAREAYALCRLCEEGFSERLGQLPCQVHTDELHRSSLPCLLRRHDLFLPRCASRGTSSPRAPAARQRAWGSLIASLALLSIQG